MEEYLNEMKNYEYNKFSYSLADAEQLLTQEDFLSSFTTMVNNEMGTTYLDEKEFSIFVFITKENNIYKKPLKFVFNDLHSKIFGTSNILGKSKHSDSIQNFFNEIQNNKKIKQSDFKIEFFVFSKKQKQKSKRFNNIFKLVKKEYDKFQDIANELHISSPSKNFLIDTTNFVGKYWLFIFGILTLYVYIYSRYQLLTLGFPREIISTVEILSVLKLYAVAFMPYYVGIGLFIIITVYVASKYEKSENFYVFLKGLGAVAIYGVFIIFAYNFHLIKFKKSDIQNDDTFLIEYLYEGYYPRVAKDKDDDILLILGEANKKIYYYQLKDFEDINQSKICKLLETKKSNHFESNIIEILKDSKFSHTKNIIQTNKTSNFKIFNKDISLKELKRIYCLEKKET